MLKTKVRTIEKPRPGILNFDEAYYDLELYDGSGSCAYTIRLLEGKVKLSKQVTR